MKHEITNVFNWKTSALKTLSVVLSLFIFGTTATAQLPQICDVTITLDELVNNGDCGDSDGTNDTDPRWLVTIALDGIQIPSSPRFFGYDDRACGTYTNNINTVGTSILPMVYSVTEVCPPQVSVNMDAWEEDRGSNNTYDCCNPILNDDDAFDNGQIYNFAVSGLPQGVSSLTTGLTTGGRYGAHLTITYNDNPTLFVVPDGPVNICRGGTAVLNAVHDFGNTPTTSGTFNWYADAARTTFLGTGPTLTLQGVLNSTTVYCAELFPGPCESAPTPMNINVGNLFIDSIIEIKPVGCPGGADAAWTFMIREDAGLSNGAFWDQLFISKDSFNFVDVSSAVIRTDDPSVYTGNLNPTPAFPTGPPSPPPYFGSTTLLTLQDAGTYSVSMTTTAGCNATFYDIITISDPPGTLDSVAVINPKCAGDANDSVLVWFSGVPAIDVLFSGPSTGTYLNFTSSPAVVVGQGPGANYTVTMRINGDTCEIPWPNTISIVDPQPLTVSILDAISPGCPGDTTGSIVFNNSVPLLGGQSPYQFSIDGGSTYQSSSEFYNLAAGAYNVVVRDANGCIDGTVVNLNDPPTLIIRVDSVDNACPGATTGQILISTLSGGTPPYLFFVNGSNVVATVPPLLADNLPAGQYLVQVIDDNGCEARDTISINNIDTMIAFFDSVADVSCAGGSDGFVSISTTSSTPPLMYSYDGAPSIPSSTKNDYAAGFHYVVVTDLNGCEATIDTTIFEPSPININVDTVWLNQCFGDSTGRINLSISGGTPGYIFAWSDGGPATEDRINLTAGTYTVTVTDTNGCTATEIISVTQPLLLEISVADSFNISCKDGSDGSIDITVSGGTLPYSYAWSNGINTEDNINLTPGTYTVTVSDLYGCMATRSVTLTEPDSLNITGVVTNASCNFVPDGAIDITVTGGTGPYTFLWSNFSVQEDLVNVVFGTYTVVVTDANGCTITEDFIVNENSTLTVLGTQTDVSCNGLTDGEVDLFVAGGAAPYSFMWSNGELTEDVTNLAPGFYLVTVTDFLGCNFIQSFNIMQPDPITINDSIVLATCGVADGQIILDVSGGTAPYNYLWSDSSSTTTKDLTGVYANIYSVTVTDFNACTSTASFTLNNNTTLTVTDTVSDALCFGDANGEIDLTTSMGAAPYSWNWSNGDMTEDVTGLAAGEYRVTITDNALCQIFDIYQVNEPDTLISISSTTPNNDCFSASGPNGTVDITPTGGTPPYTYLWSNTQTTQDLDSLIGGIYTVTITDDNGCQAILSDSVGQVDTIDVVAMVSSLTCNSDTTATINLTVSGGVPNYSYMWSNGSTAEDQINLGVGVYTVTITDQAGCLAIRTYTILAPTAITISAATVGASCNGGLDGSIDLTVGGGTPPYTFFWSTTDTTEDLTGIASGFYDVTVTDSAGCVETRSIIVNDNSTITITDTVTDISCFSFNDGAADMTISGGTAPLNYNWSTGAITEDISGLSSGAYALTVEDAVGCRSFALVNINEPAPLIVTGLTFPASCNGGSDGFVALNIVGGTPGFTYNWSNATSNDSLLNVSAGSYLVTVTDANTCTTISSFNVSENSTVIVNGVVSDVSCFGLSDGQIDLNVVGGAIPYSYTWNDLLSIEDRTGLTANNYTVSVTDNNMCTSVRTFTVDQPDTFTAIALPDDNNTCSGLPTGSILVQYNGGNGSNTYIWSNGAITPSLFGISGGTYSVTATDAMGCQLIITETISDIDSLTVNVTANDISCNGQTNGSINLNVLGGTPPYTYNWSNGSTAQNLSNLMSGSYDVTIVDKFGCSDTITGIMITEPTAITTTISATNVSCNGANDGTVTLTVGGGTAPYQFLWNNGDTTQNISGLAGGNYSVIISDANGCLANAAISLGEPTAITASSATTDVDCKYNSTGAVDVTISGGTAPYTYLWSNSATTQDVSSVPAGMYILTITDDSLCMATDTFMVDEPDSALDVIPLTITDVTCFGANNGAIDIFVSGGTTPYGYSWSTGAFVEDVSGLAPNTYDVTVTDANGCTEIESNMTISEPSALSVSITVDNGISCNGANDAQLTANPTGGTAPYTYIWSNFEFTQTATGFGPGNASVVVTDANGCSGSASTNLTEPAAITHTDSTVDVNCFGESTGAAGIITVSGGAGGFTYSWNTGSTDPFVLSQPAGNYSVTITDANSCDKVVTLTVDQRPQLVATTNSVSPACFGDNTGSASVFPTGGTPPYEYVWDNGSTAIQINNLAPGDYVVTVTDDFNCEATDTTTVTPADTFAIMLDTSGITCVNGTNGSVTINLMGGLAPYTYKLIGSPTQTSSNTSATFDNLGAGTYSIEVIDANNCEINESITLIAPATAIPDLIIDQALPGPSIALMGQMIDLKANIDPIDLPVVDNINWYSNGVALPTSICNTTECDEVTVTVDEDTRYRVDIIDVNGCVAGTDTLSIFVREENAVFVPSGFTPNGDGLNDFFNVIVLDYASLNLSIYDRWGNEIWSNPNIISYDEQNDESEYGGWDGADANGNQMPIGTYIYQLEITNDQGNVELMHGAVSLVR